MTKKKQYTYILILAFIFFHQLIGLACDVNFVVTSNQPKCVGDSDGNITVIVTSGTSPFLYSFDGGNTFSTENNLDSIPIGTYEILVQDAEECENSLSYTIYDPPPLEADLGEDITVELGDVIELNAQVIGQFNYTYFSAIELVSFTCPQCLEIQFVPLQSQTIYFTVRNYNICEVTDSIQVEVVRPDAVFIPNAFTPNGDGYNDYLFIHAGQSVAKVKTFHIIDNWGNLVYEAINFSPNDTFLGWDGIFDGKKMTPGVFIYCAEVEYIDGETKYFCGDVSLIN